jgi:hypothetical protein
MAAGLKLIFRPDGSLYKQEAYHHAPTGSSGCVAVTKGYDVLEIKRPDAVNIGPQKIR